MGSIDKHLEIPFNENEPEPVLNIYVQGSMQQTFEIVDPDYSVSDVIELVKSGKALTSIGHNEDNGNVLLVTPQGGIKTIAKIVSQSSGGDMEITHDADSEEEL